MGDLDLDLLPAPFLAQPLVDDLRLFQVRRQQHLGRNSSRLVIILPDKGLQHLGVFLVRGAFQHEIFLSDQLSGTHKKHLHAGLVLRAGNGDHIRIDILGGDDLLLLHHPGSCLDLVPQHGGPLKEHFVGSFPHFLLELFDDLVRFSLQKIPEAFHHAVVLFLCDGADAGPGA